MTSSGAVAVNDIVGDLLADLDAERMQLRKIVQGVDPADWAAATSSPGWSVRDQIAHLAFFDEMAARAVSYPAAFEIERARALADTSGYNREHLSRVPPGGSALLAHWTGAAELFRTTVRTAPSKARVPWYGPNMGLASMVSARLMEHWAHGHDVAEGLAVRREPTARLRHVADLAVRARGYGYVVRGQAPSGTPVRVELIAPSGSTWVFGPEDADESITGEAEDFCLVLVRRRHVDDSGLAVSGPAAQEWLEIGQAYAGPPGDAAPRA